MAGRVEVLPSVLARDAATYRRRFQRAAALGTIIHLDIMDGRFVTSRSIRSKTLGQLPPKPPVEIHAMVAEPEQWLTDMLRLNLRRVIVPVELGVRLRPFIAVFRSRRIPVVLSINPGTPLSRLHPWVSVVAGIQVMGVEPGQYGAPFLPKTFSRIQAIHRRYPRLPIQVDGGITPDKIVKLRSVGATRFVVGSFFMKAKQPTIAWQQLRQALSRA